MCDEDRGKPGLGPEKYPTPGTGCSSDFAYEFVLETLGLGVVEAAGDRWDGGV